MTSVFLILWLIVFIATALIGLYILRKKAVPVSKAKLLIYSAIYTYISLLVTALVIGGFTQFLSRIATPEYCQGGAFICDFTNLWEKYSVIIVLIIPVLTSTIGIKYFANKQAAQEDVADEAIKQ